MAACLGPHHLQAQHGLENIEVTIAVQQLVTCFQTEGSYQAIDGPPYRVTTTPQTAIVLGGSDGQVCSARREDLEFLEIIANLGERRIITNPLQYLTQN